ncbi:MAG: DUF1684 domain-containing protein [Anaerolineales bacterium]
MTDKTYQQSIEEWRKQRDEGIRKENSWLALYGLNWLKLGKNKLGSDASCEVQLPPRVPAHVGYLDYNGKFVAFHIEPNASVTINGKKIDFAILQTDEAEQPSFIQIMDVQLVVIQRGNRFGARIWDNQRKERKNFPPRKWFDVNEQFRIAAAYHPYERPKSSYFPDVTGEKAEFPVEGYVEFSFNGATYQLDVNKEDENTLFIRFWDPTSEEETYPTGRYLSADIEKDSSVMLDFNKAYSPPCAFTNFATCVFAPEQNRLDFKILAGEKYARH